MLAKAVAHHTTASFIRVVGSEFVQKYLGEGPRMVRDVFRLAKGRFSNSLSDWPRESSLKWTTTGQIWGPKNHYMKMVGLEIKNSTVFLDNPFQDF